MRHASGDRPGGTPSPLVLRPVANARDLAHNAAVRAAGQPAVRPRPDQWAYAQRLVAESTSGSGRALLGPSDKRVTVERWSKLDGTRSAHIDGGRLKVRTLSPMERHGSIGADHPYLLYVLSLPRDPRALLTRVDQLIDAEGGRSAPGEQRAARAFQIFQTWMHETVLPPDLRAAMYQAIVRLPGVEYQNTAGDLAGRKGVTLYRVQDGYLRAEIIIDPTTYAYLGFRNLAVHDGPVTTDERGTRTRVPKGRVLGWGATLRAAIVDSPGQRGFN